MRVVTLLTALAMLSLPAGAGAAGDPLRAEQWGLTMVESDAAHAFSTGAGAIVAVVDSGVRTAHPDLARRLLPGYDFVDNDTTPQDGNRHGTHVSGIVAAVEGNGVGVSSVAPGAQVLPVRVLGNDGSGTTDDVAAGIDWAVDHGAHVINLSLGQEAAILGADTTFATAVDRALDRGVIVVAAAGNNGLPVCEQPDGAGRLLCVGAVDRRRTRSFFSSFGQGLGVVAPGGSGLPVQGEDVLSTYTGPDYLELAGTSQAAPHVAGVAALLVARGVRGQDAVNRILATAVDAGPAGPDDQYGAGIVNARRALEGLPSGSGTPPGGTPGTGGAGVGGTARISFRRVQRIGAVLTRGVRVRCLAAQAGRCRVSVMRRGRRLAAGSRNAVPGSWVTVRAPVTARGRVRLRRALRSGTSLRVRLRVRLPGASTRVFRMTLRP